MMRFFLIGLFFYAGCLHAQLEAALEALKTDEALEKSTLGLVVMQAASGEILLDYQGTSYFYPASIQKIVTTATASALLPDNFQWVTQAFVDGEIKDGVLHGNVWVNASGDPSLNSGYFIPNFKTDLIQALKNKGIHTIQGEINLLKNQFEHGTPQSWLFEDIGNYYGVAPQGFNYRDNMYSLTFQQSADGQGPGIIQVNPEVPYTFKNNVLCSSSQTGDHSYILGASFSYEREIVGTITAGKGTFTIKGANAHPFFTFQKELASAFVVKGESLDKGRLSWLMETKSPPLNALVKTTNFESVNLFAEGILNTLGDYFLGEYSTAGGIQVILDYIKQIGLTDKEIRMKDGSGLSRLNAMTPFFAASWIRAHLDQAIFAESLPVSGVSGTLRFLNHPGVHGRIHAKSGSAEGVVNYAGYFTNERGEQIIFALFVNHAYGSKSKIRKAIGKFLEECLKS